MTKKDDRSSKSDGLVLAAAGLVCGVGGGHYVLVRTLDGRPVTYTQTIGPSADDEVGS